MKTAILFLSFFAMVCFLQVDSVAQNSNDALQYMKALTEPVNSLKDETWKYLKAITNEKGARKVEAKRQTLLSEMKDKKTEISKVKPFESDETLKKAILSFLDLSYSVIKEDYDKILDMEAIAEESYDLMEAYILAREKADEKLDSAANIVSLAENEFALKYKITLVEGEKDKISQKIKKASEALDYYNKIYLCFFKCYKQEAYVLEALNKNDVNGVEQNSKSLGVIVDEELAKIKTAGGYKGDINLKSAAEQLLKFYKEESNDVFSSYVDFSIKKDSFEKIQKVVESKKEKDRTQQDIDQYNKAVKEYNDSVNAYNVKNDAANKNRTKFMENWNGKTSSFFDTHAN